MPIYISDNEIIFFLLARNQDIQVQLSEIVAKYNEDYEELIVGNLAYPKCCRNDQVVPIIYGYPGWELAQQAE